MSPVLTTKARILRDLLEAKHVVLGEVDGKLFVDMQGKRGDGLGHKRTEFATRLDLHRYLDQKIKTLSWPKGAQ